MATIDPTTLEALLNMGESAILDFKEAQYDFEGATDEQKAKLLKDILAFANAWKTTDAHIVIGARDNHGTRATLTGVGPQGHIDDAKLQQFVNAKTNQKVDFVYVPLTVEGHAIAVVRIARKQHRPIYLNKPYAKLEAGAVYLRRGSTTDKATTDEIVRMAQEVGSTPVLDIQLGDPESRSLQGTQLHLHPRVLVDRPAPTAAEREAMAKMRKSLGLDMFEQYSALGRYAKTIARIRDPYAPDPKAVTEHRRRCALLTKLAFVVHNTGSGVVHDLRLVMEVPRVDGLIVLDEEPEAPHGGLAIPITRVASLHRPETRTDVFERPDHFEVKVRLGKVQSGATTWSKPIWIGGESPAELLLPARVFADNLSEVPPVSLTIKLLPREEYDDGPSDDEGDDDENEA